MSIKALKKLIKLVYVDAPVCVWVQDGTGRTMEIDPEGFRVVNGRLVIDLQVPVGSISGD